MNSSGVVCLVASSDVGVGVVLCDIPFAPADVVHTGFSHSWDAPKMLPSTVEKASNLNANEWAKWMPVLGSPLGIIFQLVCQVVGLKF